MIAIPPAPAPAEEPMADKAVFPAPAKPVGFTGTQPAAVAAEEPKPAPPAAAFEVKRFAVPLLGLFALAALALWGARRARAAGDSSSSLPKADV
jgi:hypothetical protein